MIQVQEQPTPESRSGRNTSGRRGVARVAAAAGIVLGTLAAASPSWAGPLMGC